MDGNAIIALVGGVVVAFIIRVFNVVVEWLARVLGVKPPDPIPPLDHTGQPVSDSPTGSTPP